MTPQIVASPFIKEEIKMEIVIVSFSVKSVNITYWKVTVKLDSFSEEKI